MNELRIEGVTVRVYGPAKTVADCFKFRNKIGLDVALEALRDYRRKHRAGLDELCRFARSGTSPSPSRSGNACSPG